MTWWRTGVRNTWISIVGAGGASGMRGSSSRGGGTSGALSTTIDCWGVMSGCVCVLLDVTTRGEGADADGISLRYCRISWVSWVVSSCAAAALTSVLIVGIWVWTWEPPMTCLRKMTARARLRRACSGWSPLDQYPRPQFSR